MLTSILIKKTLHIYPLFHSAVLHKYVHSFIIKINCNMKSSIKSITFCNVTAVEIELAVEIEPAVDIEPAVEMEPAIFLWIFC